MDYGDSASGPTHPHHSPSFAPRPAQPPQQHGSPYAHSPDDEQYNGGTPMYPIGVSASAAAALANKGRSAIACVLCRRQKMKCSGGSPCRRCKTSGVPCVFESPPVSTPRPRASTSGVSEAWVESRLMSVEDRLATLETEGPGGQALALNQHDRGSPVQDHEHRIAQLEAQIYSLQLAATNPHLSRSLPASSLPSSFLRTQAPPVAPNPYSFPTHLQNPQPLAAFSGNSSPYPAHQPPHHQVSAPYPSYPPAGRHTFPAGPGHTRLYDGGTGFRDGASPVASGSSNGDSAAGRELYPAPSSERGEKRWKGAGGAVDFITRGEVSVDEATLCFDSYFLNFNFIKPANPSLSLPIHLPFTETRHTSALLLATIVFIGARALSHFETSALALAEALRLCHYTFVPESPPTAVDFKAIILLSLYTGMEDLIPHAVGMAFELGLPDALLRYEELSEQDKASSKGSALVVNGRAFLISHMWTAFYTYNRGKAGGYHISPEVLRHQVDILEASVHTQQPTDRLIRVEVEACILLRVPYNQLGPGQRVMRPSPEELCDVVGAAITELETWSRRWLDMMELVCTWGDNAELKTAVPFHHNRMNLLMWVFRDVTPATAGLYPRIREFAQMAHASALHILRFGVESRIWLPHSMVGQYLLHCNIPTCLYILDLTSRLFPEDANFSVIRRLLHRLLSQCEDQLRALTGTCRELARARVTRDAVIALDRYAFEISGESDPEPAQSEESLFGEDLSGSLSALGGELNLWGIVLLSALEKEEAPPFFNWGAVASRSVF